MKKISPMSARISKMSVRESQTTKKPDKISRIDDLVFFGFLIAIIFIGVYLILGIFDDLHTDNERITKSRLFIYNCGILINLFILIFVMYFENYSEKFSMIKLLFSASLLTLIGFSSKEMKNFLNDSRDDKEETSQFIISLIALSFAGVSGAALLLNMLVYNFS